MSASEFDDSVLRRIGRWWFWMVALSAIFDFFMAGVYAGQGRWWRTVVYLLLSALGLLVTWDKASQTDSREATDGS